MSCTVVIALLFGSAAVPFAHAQSTAPPIILNAPGEVQAQLLVSKGPKVNVLDTDFAGGADPSGAKDSTGAIAAAFSYAQSLVNSSVGAPVVYFPRGIYTFSSFPKVNGAAISIEGDGSSSTVLNTTATSGDVLEITNASGPVGSHFHVSGLTINGLGHLSAVNLVEIVSAINLDMHDVSLENTGGICLNLQGAERDDFTDVEFTHCRRPVNLGQNSNEDYFRSFHILDPGNDNSNWSWNVNATPSTGGYPSSGTYLPDYNAAVTVFNSQNTHFEDGSIKSTRNMGCYHYINANGFHVAGTYCESAVPANAPQGSVNPDLQVGGATPMTRTTASMTTTSTSVAVDDALYNPMYIGDNANTGAVPSYGAILYPPDYKPGSNALSSLCAGISGCTITQSTTESVSLTGFTGAAVTGSYATPNGTATIAARGGTPQAWPKGAVLVGPVLVGDASDGVSTFNHWNGVLGPPSNWTNGCSPTALTSQWIYTPSATCGEFIVGPVYNGFDQLTPKQAAPGQAGFLSMLNDVLYSGGGGFGYGVAAISENGSLTQSGLCSESTSQSTSNSNIFAAYTNGYCQMAATQYPDGSAAYVLYQDIGSKTEIDSVRRTYTQFSHSYDVNNNPNYLQYYNSFKLTDTAQTFWENLNPSGATFRLASTGQDSFQITGANVTSLVPFVASGGISYAQDAYNANPNVAESAGKAYAQWNPSAAGTFTLPPVSARGYFTLLVPANNTQAKTVGTGGSPNGNIFVGAASVGATWTWPNGYPGAVTFYSDGVNWQVLNPIGVTKTCTATPTVVAGVVTNC